MKNIKAIAATVLGVFTISSTTAMADSGKTAAPRPENPRPEYTLGTELDALPFLMGGYYFSIIGGVDRFRLRAIVSQLTLPSFVYDSSRFGPSSLHVSALVVDYFFAPLNRGYWIGGGFEKWTGNVTGKMPGTSGAYEEWVSTLGAGYHWVFYQNFYLNPWIAVHWQIAGDQQAQVGQEIYQIRSLQGEGSVKVGWSF